MTHNAYQTNLSDAARIIIQHEELRGDIARLAVGIGLPADMPPFLVLSCARDMASALWVYKQVAFDTIVGAVLESAPPKEPSDD